MLLAIGITAVSVPVAAHHSGTLWDPAKQLTLHGTVRQFQWTNPHCFIQLRVPADASGNNRNAPEQEWNIEMAAPFQVLTGGWKPGTLKPGDKIAVTVHPARDGSTSGDFVSAVTAGGQPLGHKAGAP
jgi:hypothetical protein